MPAGKPPYSGAMRFLFLLALMLPTANARVMTVRWSETPAAFAGKIVQVELANGAKIEGSWISVTATDFTVKAVKDSGGYPAAAVRVAPRSSIRKIGVRSIRVRGRLWGAFGGFFAPAAIASAVKPRNDDPTIGVVMIASGVAGYLIGSHLDHTSTERVVLVDP